mgnify:CR=1 FL=1
MSHLRCVVLASGRGSNLQSLLDVICQKQVDASIVAVLSNKEKAQALERARKLGIPDFWINPQGYPDKKAFEGALLEIIRTYQADIILLAGFMLVLSPFFIQQARVPIINIHPALLPAFPGLHAQRQALEYGVRYSGCTVHFVDEGVDSGPIILQAVVPVLPEDTEETLSQRILVEEHRLYPRVLQLLCAGRIACRGRKVMILGEGEGNE